MNFISNLKNNMLGDKAFYRHVLMIVLPIIIQNTVTNVVSLLDNVMVGRLGTLEMSAVAIVNQLIFVFNLCVFGALSGPGMFATQYVGANDEKGVRHCFRIKIIMSIIIIIAAVFIFTIFPEKLICLYLSKNTLAEEASATMLFAMDYIRIMVIGLIPFTISQVYSSSLRENGETRLPMYASVFGIFINLILNYLLIFGKFGFPGLGVSGAALATVVSRFAEMIIVAVFTHIKKDVFRFIKGVYKGLYIPRNLWTSVLKKGTPILINEFLWSAGIATYLQCYSVRGLEVVAAANIASTITNLFNVVFISIGSAVAIMVGQCLGANEIEKAKITVWRLLTLSFLSCVVIGGILTMFAPIVPNVYNTEIQVKQMATDFLIITSVMLPVQAFVHSSYFALRSGGKTIITFFFDSGFMWGVCVPVAYILANFTNINVTMLYFAVLSIDYIKLVIGFILIKKGVWISNIIH